MAPLTRSFQHRQSISGAGSRQIPSETDMSEALEPSQSEEAGDVESAEDQITDDGASAGDSDEDFFHQQQGSSTKSPPGRAEDMLQPLQQTADRVSRQVEDFARRLDRFYASRDNKHTGLWQDVLGLVGAYKTVATSRRSQTSSDLLQARHLPRKRQSFQAVADEGQLELQRAQKEADLWQLVSTLSGLWNPEVCAEYTKSSKSCLKGLHRYSSDSEIWQVFLSVDQRAVEYQQMLKWLHRSASTTRPSIDDLTASLRTKADRGDGVWSAGWLFTKESIKSQKRNRIWPKPLDPSNPGLESSLRRKSDSARLVAQLDPDAKGREAAALEEADEYHEQAAWLACWEMFRRGTSTEVLRDWWSERKENWRAISVGAAKSTSLESEDREWNRFINLWRVNEWASSCFKLSRSDSVGNKHEAAVYGLLCGDLQTPLDICQTIEDHLFVHLNAFLIERYKEFGAFLTQNDARRSFCPSLSKYDELQRLVQYCQHHEKMAHESRDPLNTIQNTIISKDYSLFFLRQGRALARISTFSGQPSTLIVSDGSREINESAEILASDPDGLRIVAHLLLVLKPLGVLDRLYPKHEAIVENNITAYIGWLRHEGKMALIPLYASTLSRDRGARVLGAVITDVTDAREREMMVNLIRKYNMDMSRILLYQFHQTASAFGLKGRENPKIFNPIVVTQYVGTAKMRNLKVKPAFMGEEFEEAEELLSQCLEWYRYGDRACWAQICKAASTIYKFFISRGKLAAARALNDRAPLSQISKAVLGFDPSEAVTPGDVSSGQDNAEMDGSTKEQAAEPSTSHSKHGRRSRKNGVATDDNGPGTSFATLAEQAKTWRQLEELVEAMASLEKWDSVAAEFERSKNDVSQFRAVKRVLQDALDDVRITMLPLLEPDFLSHPSDESELPTLTNIRNHYLCECILAYNSVLYFAGHALSRNRLVECMNLAQVVATNHNLTIAFMDTMRMKELVTAFALSSKAMLHANEQGKGSGSGSGSGNGSISAGSGSGSGKKSRRDGSLETWQVRPQDVGLVPDKIMQEILGRENNKLKGGT